MIELKRVKTEEGMLPEDWSYELYKAYMLDKSVRYVVDVSRMNGSELIKCYGNTYFEHRQDALDAVTRLVEMLADPHFSDSNAA